MDILQVDTAFLSTHGYALLKQAVSADTIEQLNSLLAPIFAGKIADEHDLTKSRGESAYAVRHVFMACPAAKDLVAASIIPKLAEEVLGCEARLIRSLLFSKPPGANWRVPWHQDLTIAVNRKLDLPGFGPWSLKSGIVHVQPPREVMQQCISLRIHLEDSSLADGPLRVLPGSHQTQEPGSQTHQGEVICEAHAGDILFMRPLLMHRSLPAEGGEARRGYRRVLHLEFSSAQLPAGLDWAEVGF